MSSFHRFDIVCPECKKKEVLAGSLHPDDPKLVLDLESVEVERRLGAGYGVRNYVIMTGVCLNCNQRQDLFNYSAKLLPFQLAQRVYRETLDYLRLTEGEPEMNKVYQVPVRAFRSIIT